MWLFTYLCFHFITQVLSDTITCNGLNACKDQARTCKQNEACTINCNGYQSCQRSTLNCPAGYSCTINCIDAEKNCESAAIMAADSSVLWINGCDTTSPRQCENMIVWCPAGAQSANKCHISGANSRPRYIHIHAINGWYDVQMSYSGNLYGSGGSDMHCESSSCTISSDGWYCQRTGTLSACDVPTMNPTKRPTKSPTKSPTENPTKSPTENPTKSPTENPTKMPTENPTKMPTENPTKSPTGNPTKMPTENPTKSPTKTPTENPTYSPTLSPSPGPTTDPTDSPTRHPTNSPTTDPTDAPSRDPTNSPTITPTTTPTEFPTNNPSLSAVATESISQPILEISIMIVVIILVVFVFVFFLWQKKKMGRLKHNNDFLQELLLGEITGDIVKVKEHIGQTHDGNVTAMNDDNVTKRHVELVEGARDPAALLNNNYAGEGMEANEYDNDVVSLVNTIH